jgi:hypothetical protein
MRSLGADDIAAAQSLYGRTTTSQTNTAPSLTITSPSNNGSFSTTSSVSFTASSSDSQDGNLSSRIAWSSTLVGQLGFGGSLSALLPAGTHVITAMVTDSGGLTTSKSVTITVTAPVVTQPAPTATPTLSASGYKVKKNSRADLTWSGITSTNVDIYRNGSRVTATANDGFYTDSIKGNGNGTYRYKACNAGTSTCSNEASVTF